jgi:hypothetical protein
MPAAVSIFTWLLDPKKKEFLEQYETARNIQAELMFEELLEIADDGTNDYIEKEYENGRTVEVPEVESDQSGSVGPGIGSLPTPHYLNCEHRIDFHDWNARVRGHCRFVKCHCVHFVPLPTDRNRWVYRTYWTPCRRDY